MASVATALTPPTAPKNPPVTVGAIKVATLVAPAAKPPNPAEAASVEMVVAIRLSVIGHIMMLSPMKG
jgi:hypothetical protein